MIGLSRTNIQDLVYAYFSQRYDLPPKDQLTWNWKGFESELEMRIKDAIK